MPKTNIEWITIKIENEGQKRLTFRAYLEEGNLPLVSIRVENGEAKADYQGKEKQDRCTVKLDNRSVYHEPRDKKEEVSQ